MFSSTKRFGPISTCHRNWHAAHNTNRNSQKCAKIHGYSRYVQFTFIGDTDDCGWVYDFGDCQFIKDFLENNWDHKVLVSSDDPDIELLNDMDDSGIIDLTIIDASNNLNWGPGMEGSCKHLYDSLKDILKEKTKGRVKFSKIEVWEHENNSAVYIPE